MGREAERKGLNCGKSFKPDARNVRHQQYCPATLCQGASKRASQARWLAKPENRGYFMGAQAVARVQVWRAAHPGYSRRGPTGEQPPPSSEALQEVLPAQPSESSMISCNAPEPVTAPLQDVLSRQPTVIIGLIAHLWDSPLQEDIAAILHRLLQLVVRSDKTYQAQAMARSNFFQRKTTGAAFSSLIPWRMRVLSSSTEVTRICRRKERAIFEKAHSMRLSHDPCLGVWTYSKRPGRVARKARVSFEMCAE